MGKEKEMSLKICIFAAHNKRDLGLVFIRPRFQVI